MKSGPSLNGCIRKPRARSARISVAVAVVFPAPLWVAETRTAAVSSAVIDTTIGDPAPIVACVKTEARHTCARYGAHVEIIGLDHVQVAAPIGSEDDARRFYGRLLGLSELEK